MNFCFGILLIECVISFWGPLLSAGCFCIHSPLGSPISRNLELWSLVNVVPTPPRPSRWWRSLQNVHVAKQGTSWRCGGWLRLAETTADVCRPALIREFSNTLQVQPSTQLCVVERPASSSNQNGPMVPLLDMATNVNGLCIQKQPEDNSRPQKEITYSIRRIPKQEIMWEGHKQLFPLFSDLHQRDGKHSEHIFKNSGNNPSCTNKCLKFYVVVNKSAAC